MSPTPTIMPEAVNMPLKLRNLVGAPRPEISFQVLGKKKTYTTLDRIEGVVTVVAPVDTNFDSVEIEFIGTSRTFVERLTTAAAASGRSEAYHQFLKLSQPGLEGLYPSDLVLKAGKEYKFPFVFAVPEELLPRICQHKLKNENETVRQAHLRLPPTFGDTDLGARSAENLDDIAPEMASIRYGIFAKVTELRTHKNDVWRSTIASKARRVRVIPSIEEQPPLDVHEDEGEYLMRREKTIRKSLFKGRTGTLTMEAAQPAAFPVRSYNNPDSPTSTTATVMLRFDPADPSAPLPKLGNLASKLKVATYFASTARSTFPAKKDALLDISAGVHSEQFVLSSRCMANAEWTHHPAGNTPSRSSSIERRDSSNSLDSGAPIPEPSHRYQGGDFYTARLVVPLTLPSTKNFVPTFHSCLVSRIYVLKFDLGIAGAGIGPKMEVKVPVQITSDGLRSEGDAQRRSSVDSAVSVDADVDAEDVSAFFEPRMMRTTEEGVMGRRRIGSQAPVDDAPPGYSGVPLPTSQRGRRLSGRRQVGVPVY